MRSTSYAPQEVIFGPKDLNYREYKFEPSLPQEYIAYTTTRRAIIAKSVRDRLRAYDEQRRAAKQKRERELKNPSDDIMIGDWVLYDVSLHNTGNKRKLGSHWVGTYGVV